MLHLPALPLQKWKEKKDFKVEKHVQISLFGNKNELTKLTDIAAKLTRKIQTEAKPELSTKEQLHIISLLKEVLKSNNYNYLKLILGL